MSAEDLPPLQGTNVYLVGFSQPFLVTEPAFEKLRNSVLYNEDEDESIAVEFMWRTHVDLPWEPHRGTLRLSAILATVEVQP